jgi:hypothetical protein
VNDFPHVAPPPDGLQRAFADARGRRLRSAGLSTSTVAAGLAVLALVAGGQGTQSLVQQPSPEQPAVSQLVPDGQERLPSVPRPNQGHNVQVYDTTQQRGTAAGTGTTGTAQSGATRSLPLRDQHASPRGAGSRYVAGPIVRNEHQPNIPTDTTCALPAGNGNGPRLCTYVYSSSASQPPYQLQAEVCSYQTSLTLLHYLGRNEVDMTISQKGHELWRWSRWHPDGGPSHTLGLEANECTQWRFDWTGVDATGRRLPKGTYTLSVTFLANELAGHRVGTSTVTIS